MRRPNLDFYAMGLANGDVIRSVDGETATICSNRKVLYQGHVISFTELTRRASRDGRRAPRQWFHGEIAIWQLYEATYPRR